MKLIGMFFLLCVAVAARNTAELLMRLHDRCWNRAEYVVDAVLQHEEA